MFVLQGASDPECLQQDRRDTEAAQRQAHPRPQVAVRLVSTLHGQYSLTRSTARPCVRELSSFHEWRRTQITIVVFLPTPQKPNFLRDIFNTNPKIMV